MQRNNKGARVALTILCGFLGLVLTAMIVITVIAVNWSNQVNRVDGTVETLSQEQMNQILAEDTVSPDASTAPVMREEDMDWGENNGQIIQTKDDVVNILLIGQDARPGEGRSRSDSMILVTFNKDKKTITMTSFLRDLYVQIPGYQDNKLNATYAFGGMPLLNSTLEKNFGLRVDGNVEVNFAYFADVINALGGVDLELRADEAGTINNATGRQELGEGLMHLDGEQALVYSRIRHLDWDADFSRTNRQRKVINALIEKFRNTDLITLLGIMDDLLPMITTDMSNKEMIKLATELFPMLKDATIVSQRIPADGAYELKTIRSMSCVVADMDEARKLLEETLGG